MAHPVMRVIVFMSAYLGSNLVAALASLQVDDFSHGGCRVGELRKAFTSLEQVNEAGNDLLVNWLTFIGG